jgi:hypothetical protein
MPLRYYDIKLLDQNPSELEKTLLEQFAIQNGETYREGWLNDNVRTCKLCIGLNT